MEFFSSAVSAVQYSLDPRDHADNFVQHLRVESLHPSPLAGVCWMSMFNLLYVH